MMARHKVMLHCLLLLLISQCAEVEVGPPRSSNSPLLSEDRSLNEDSNIQIHLKRQKRNVNQQLKYELDVALNLTGNFTDRALKLFLERLNPIQIQIENGTFNITNITLTTVCQHVNNETQCRCDNGFIWNSTFCSKYQSCSVNITEDRSCDCIRNEPTEGTYCDLPTVSTTPTSTPRITTTPTTVSTTPTQSTVSTTTPTTKPITVSTTPTQSTVSTTTPTTKPTTVSTTTTTVSTSITTQDNRVNQQLKYELDVALNLTGNFTDRALKLFLERLNPIQIQIENGTFNITNITLTTVCQHVNNETQCRCDNGFIWNSTFCSKYQSCSVNITEDRSCDCIRNEPTEGTYCDLPTVSTTPTSTPRITTTPTTVSTTPTQSTVSTTTPTTTPTTVSTTPTQSTVSTTTPTTKPTTVSTTPTQSTVSTTTPTTKPTTVSTTPTQSTVSTTTPTTKPITVSTTTTTVSTSLTTQDNRERQNFAVTVSELSFTDDLNNSSSSLYKNLSIEFKILLENVYRKVRPDAVVTILGFSKGSIIILHEVATTNALTNDEVNSQIQNLSPKYTTELLPDDEIPCQDETYGIANYNTIVEIPCQNRAGVMKRRCGKNGQYEEELDFCVSQEINNILEEVNSTKLENTFSNLLDQLSNATDVVNVNTPGNVEAVVTILTQISTVNATVNETDMKNFLETMSAVISLASIDTWQVLTNTQNENDPNPSSQLLQAVENFNTRLVLQNDTLNIKEENLELRAARIFRQNKNFSINETFANFTIEEYANLRANVFISSEEFEDTPNATVITIAYPTWIDILPNTTTFSGNFLINGLVATITLNVKNPVNINLTFSPRNQTLDLNTAVCAFWDFSGNGAWNNTGCKREIIGENILCNCKHLTSFSMLMSPDLIDDPALTYITIIGVAVSIGCLLITIIIEGIAWKHVTKNKTSYTRHIGILNIAVNLLVADIWFIVASAVDPGTRACTAATFFIHFFYLALFFWMLTLGLLLVYRLLFLFHDLSKSVMMGISFSIGYLCPLIISVITIGVTYPRNSYTREDACWLGWDKGYPLLAFVIPALAIIAINLIILTVVIFKLLRPTIGDRSRSNNQERETFKQVVRSIAVLTPILGLTWAFGIPTFQKGSPKAFHYIFTILNAFQGFFILVFGTFMDNKVREMLMKKFSLSGFSSRTKTVESPSSTTKPSSKPNFSFHSRKKKYILTHQLYSSDNNPFQSYSSLS
ncbi:adhesion G-protein coupled receptor F1-like isoform X2 [Scyliorhinus torazame]|uniref:adhesion G-protein coupled receptor F1-like isoform X2 n=1 Tax=Scyliorhinus torazame TaxID=75743 RepID=UPI003B59A8A8